METAAANVNLKPGILASVVAIAATTLVGLYGWLSTESGELVPSEFGGGGEPIAFGTRESVFFRPVLIVAILSLAFVMIPVFDRKGTGFARNRRAYLGIWICVLALAVFMFATFAHSAVVGTADSEGRPFIGLAGAALVVLGYFMPRTTYGYVLGIRTKWTVSSEATWRATHKLAGTIAIVVGLAAIVAASVAPLNVAIGILLGGVALVIVLAAAYSFVVSRQSTV